MDDVVGDDPQARMLVSVLQLREHAQRRLGRLGAADQSDHEWFHKLDSMEDGSLQLRLEALPLLLNASESF
jgi:hypothetical protein